MDRIAHKLGLDPIELRMKNAFKAKDRTASGQVLADCDYQKILTQLQTAINEHLRDLQPTEKDKAFGIGVSGGFWGIPGCWFECHDPGSIRMEPLSFSWGLLR